MKIGLVGYQGSGKSTLFEWLTGVAADPALAHLGQSAMAPVPDERLQPLCDIYHPKKATLAALELVDTPGLSRTHEGSAGRLALIREAGCLALVVAAFDHADPRADLASFEEDLALADLEIVSGRIERLGESLKKPRPQREQEEAELAALEIVRAALESGRPLADANLGQDELKATRSFRLLAEKPLLVVVNAEDDAEDLDTIAARAGGGRPSPVSSLQSPASSRHGRRAVAVRARLELELSRMGPADRAEFERDLGLAGSRRDMLLATMLDASGQMTFFTTSDKEVRTWILRQGGTALEAAGQIHTDMARGFIRAEAIQCDDLLRLGSEREVKAQHLVRQEPKDYAVRAGDILYIKFSP